MTKKDYELIASAIVKGYKLAVENESDRWQAMGLIVASLQQDLQRDNSRFDAIKFEKAIYSKI